MPESTRAEDLFVFTLRHLSMKKGERMVSTVAEYTGARPECRAMAERRLHADRPGRSRDCYSWPNWWTHFNGIGRITWNVRIDPGKSVDLGYTWNYFWR